MEEQLGFTDFGSSEQLLAYIKEKSEDIEKVVIPQFPTITFTFTERRDPVEHIVEAGMVLHMIDGMRKVLTPRDAEIVLNDGILSRMKVKIELFRDGSSR